MVTKSPATSSTGFVPTLINIFVSPSEAFTSIKITPTIVLPLLLILISNVVFYAWYYAMVDYPWLIDALIERMGDAKTEELEGTRSAYEAMGTMGMAFVIFARPITAALSNQPSHLEMVPPLLIICGVIQVPFAIGIVFRTAMRGAGDVHWVMGMTWFSTYALRLPLAYLISGVDIPIPELLGGGVITNPRLIEQWFGLEPGLTALWLALCSEMVLRGLIFAARFFQGGWLKAKV